MDKGQNEKNIRCTYLILQGKEILKSHYGKMNYLFNLCDTHYTLNMDYLPTLKCLYVNIIKVTA